MRKIILILAFFFSINTVSADYTFSGSIDTDYQGTYIIQDTNINSYPYYKNNTNKYLFARSTYSGGTAYKWCITDDLTDFASQNCIYEKDTDFLEITGDYNGVVYPFDSDTGVVAVYVPDPGTGTGTILGEIEAKISLSNDFFTSLNTKLKDNKDFQDFIGIVLVWITYLFLLFGGAILFFNAGFKRCDLLFNSNKND